MDKVKLQKSCIFCFVLCLALCSLVGCQSATDYRLEADAVAKNVIGEKMEQVFGQARQIDIERPSDILRRRLLIEQNLPYAGESSLGTDKLKPIEHWPEENYPQAELSLDPILLLEDDKPLRLSLIQALQVGARNSFEYQSRKEDIFRAALDLDLERNEFRNIFTNRIESLLSTDSSGKRTVSGTESGGEIGLTRKLESGVELSTELAVTLANLMTMGGASSLGITADATIEIPLLRGSGRHIVIEPLTQAERNVVYSIYTFERFKKTFAVTVAREYLTVLRQLDEVKNSEENYRGLIASARRARRRADAGRLTEIQVDQAVQDELRARNRWINATEAYKRRKDAFKSLLALPPDSKVELDITELERLAALSDELLTDINDEQAQTDQEAPPADAPVILVPPDMENAGPLEIEESLAIKLALENRLDLQVTQGRVYDAQRRVVVLADALGAELTLFGNAGLGQSRLIASANLDDAKLRTNKGKYSTLLSLDLPFERTSERNAYRDSFISLERAVREVQILEDKIKLSIQNKLRDLLESRESLQIQVRSVRLAQKRVESTNLFLEAGRAEIRDLLEAQESLLSAQNLLTAAVVNYRTAELELQRDMGLLKVDEKGLWQEYSPEELYNAEG